MTTIGAAWTAGAARLAAEGIESARLDARVLLAHTMNLSPGETVSWREATAEELARYEELLARRERHEPVAYIIGEREFWSLNFEVGPGVLIPRPETETLVEEALKAFSDPATPLDVLDLGTGSGCLLIAFLADRPRAHGLGIDRSADALAWARKNVARHELESRCVLSQQDWSAELPGHYDVIFANPPYLSTDELANAPRDVAGYEPEGALDGGTDGLAAYRAIAPIIARHLKPGGSAFVEIGSTQAETVETVLKQYGLSVLRIACDLAGHPRCVVTATRP